MGAADRRRVLLERHRELVSRHEILELEDPDSDRYDDLFLRVVDATDDLIHDLDQARAHAAARRRALAYALAVTALVPLGLVAAGTAPSLWLAGAVLAGAAAAVLWLTARPTEADTPPAHQPPPTDHPAAGPPAQQTSPTDHPAAGAPAHQPSPTDHPAAGAPAHQPPPTGAPTHSPPPTASSHVRAQAVVPLRLRPSAATLGDTPQGAVRE